MSPSDGDAAFGFFGMELPKPVRDAARRHFLEEDVHGAAYTHLGHFMAWFSIAEMNLTVTLGVVVQAANMESFELLVRGMDARIKCERLRAAVTAVSTLGPNIASRIDHFEKKICKLRNLMAHRWPAFDEASQTVYFCSLGGIFNPKDGLPPRNKRPPFYSLDQIFDQAMWCNSFTSHLFRALDTFRAGQGFETDQHQSVQPKEPPMDQPQSSHASTLGRQPRKRHNQS
jgi:hypothetical protein